MSLLHDATLTARALQKNSSPIYSLHPELAQRVPIYREYSDERAAAPSSGYTVMAQYYAAHMWVHKAIKVIADNLSAIPLQVMRRTGGKKMEVEVVPNHAITTLLDNPNPEQGPEDLWREWVIVMLLGGEVGCEMVPSVSGAKMLEMWLREPQTIAVHPGALGTRYRRVSHYTINDAQGEPYRVEPDKFVHFKFKNPLSPWRGLAPITAVRNSILLDLFAQAWSKLFFEQSARPDWALITPQGVTPSEREGLEKKIADKFGGVNKSHLPIILEEGVSDIKILSFPPKDMEWLEQRNASRDEIGAIFGVPDEIMGYGRDTYENFGTAARVLWTLTIIPLGSMRDGALTRFFRKRKVLAPDEFVQSDYSNVPELQEDVTSKVANLVSLFSVGVPVNAAKHVVRLPMADVPGGDVGYLPMGLLPVDEEFSATSDAAAGEQGKGFGQLRIKAAPEFGSDAHKSLWQRKDRRLNKRRRAMRRQLAEEFERQRKEIIAQVEKQFEPQSKAPDAGDVFDLAAEIEKFEQRFLSVVREAVGEAGQDELNGLGVDMDFDMDRPEVKKAIEKLLKEVSEKTNKTTFEQLTELFEQVADDGVGTAEIVKRLNKYFDGRKSTHQLERIARTTMTGANGAGDVTAWGQSGVVEKHAWISALQPGRTREDHAEAHGQERDLDKPFDVGGEKLDYPGDPKGSAGNIINCLCSQIAIVK